MFEVVPTEPAYPGGARKLIVDRDRGATFEACGSSPTGYHAWALWWGPWVYTFDTDLGGGFEGHPDGEQYRMPERPGSYNARKRRGAVPVIPDDPETVAELRRLAVEALLVHAARSTLLNGQERPARVIDGDSKYTLEDFPGYRT